MGDKGQNLQKGWIKFLGEKFWSRRVETWTKREPREFAYVGYVG
jgi:hypothetical protein